MDAGEPKSYVDSEEPSPVRIPAIVIAQSGRARSADRDRSSERSDAA
jgi:hypothetical protein